MIDIQTFLLALGIGNVGFAVLMAGYTHGAAPNPGLQLWMWARLGMGLSQLLGWARPLLGLPFLGPLNSVEFTGSSARGQRQGVECTQDLAASLPAVLSITERTGEARFPKFKGIMTAKRKPVVLYKAADLGLGGISHAEGNLVLASSKRPARGAGTKIVDDGNAAVHLADYLSNENLI